MSKFTSLSIMMGAVTETDSLQKTAEQIAFYCDKKDIAEIIIAYPDDRVTPECRKTIEKLKKTDIGIKIIAFPQKTPFIGFFTDTVEAATGSHCMPFSSDMPMDISILPIMIEKAKKTPDVIISTSRFMPGCKTPGYPPVMKIINRCAQVFLRCLFGGGLTDYTNSTQIVPSEIYKSINWEANDFGRFLELSIKPLRLGCKFEELPVDLRQRTEGSSGNSLRQLLSYLRTALHVRFMKKEKILKTNTER